MNSMNLTFNEYQEMAKTTDLNTSKKGYICPGFLYYVLGICGECGELTEKVKKLFRDKNGIIDESFKISLEKELGDILWYISCLAYEFNIPLENVAFNNLDKLLKRKKENKLHGNGDNR